MELTKKQELNIAIKFIDTAMKEEPEEASFERLTAWCQGYLCCSYEEALEILCKIGDIIVSMTNEEAKKMNRKTWSLRIQYFKDGTLLCDTFELYTFEKCQEKILSYSRDDIELQAIRMVRI